MRRHLPMYALLLPVIGCTERAVPRGAVPDRLLAQTWALRRLNGKPVPDGSDAATLRFLVDRHIAGSSSCNRVTTPERWWTLFGHAVQWDPPGSRYRWSADPSGMTGGFEPAILATTTAGCMTAAATRSGDAFWRAMQHARRWSLAGRHLTIVFADGRTAILTAVRSPAPG